MQSRPHHRAAVPIDTAGTCRPKTHLYHGSFPPSSAFRSVKLEVQNLPQTRANSELTRHSPTKNRKRGTIGAATFYRSHDHLSIVPRRTTLAKKKWHSKFYPGKGLRYRQRHDSGRQNCTYEHPACNSGCKLAPLDHWLLRCQSLSSPTTTPSCTTPSCRKQWLSVSKDSRLRELKVHCAELLAVKLSMQSRPHHEPRRRLTQVTPAEPKHTPIMVCFLPRQLSALRQAFFLAKLLGCTFYS